MSGIETKVKEVEVDWGAAPASAVEIDKMISNVVPLGLLGPRLQALFVNTQAAGAKFLMWDGAEWRPNVEFLLRSRAYRLVGMPEVEEVEVHNADSDLTCLHYSRARRGVRPLEAALADPDFIEAVYEDGSTSSDLRRIERQGVPAKFPVKLRFRRSK